MYDEGEVGCRGVVRGTEKRWIHTNYDIHVDAFIAGRTSRLLQKVEWIPLF